MLTTHFERFRAIRARTLALVQGLSQAQLDEAPAPGSWSIGEVVDQLILSVEIIRRDVAELIELTKAGKPPHLYRSAAEFNITPFFMPKCMLPFLEVPFNLLNMVVPDHVREVFVRYRLIPARTADTATLRRGRSTAELYAGLCFSFEELAALCATHPDLDYDTLLHQHSLLGTQNVPYLLYSMGLHEERHQAHIADLLPNAQFLKAG